jgi:hypothetical protein
MTDPELRKIYKSACDGKGYEPNDGQFKVWKLTLAWCDQRDLAQALVYWFGDNTAFPMPAELKPLAERARRARTAKASAATDLVGWRCTICKVTRCGLISPEDHDPRYCQGIPKRPGYKPGEICGGNLIEVHRESCAA